VPAPVAPVVQPTPEAVQHVFQLMTGHIVASAVNIAARLGLSDRLAGGPRSADALAQECGVNADALYRVMRALASIGIFAEGSDSAAAEGEFVHVVVDRATRRPADIPVAWREKLARIS